MLLFASWLRFSRRGRAPSVLQLMGASCLAIVVLCHLCEGLGVFPWMGWGLHHSVGHYLDLVAAVLALALFPLGYLLDALGPGL
jgi:hypothetical protein